MKSKFIEFNKSRIGKTYEEMYGKEKANSIKNKLANVLRKRNIENNPSKNPLTAKKISDTKKEAYRCGKLIPFNNMGGINPSTLFEVRKKISEKAKKRCANGNFGFKKGNTYWNHPDNIKTRFSSGEEHPNWKGGLSREPYPHDWNNNFKKTIRRRDNHQCQMCEKTQKEELNQSLAVHHIDYNKKNMSPQNLITLCKSCHTKTNNQKRDYYEWQLKTFMNLFNNSNYDIKLGGFKL